MKEREREKEIERERERETREKRRTDERGENFSASWLFEKPGKGSSRLLPLVRPSSSPHSHTISRTLYSPRSFQFEICSMDKKTKTFQHESMDKDPPHIKGQKWVVCVDGSEKVLSCLLPPSSTHLSSLSLSLGPFVSPRDSSLAVSEWILLSHVTHLSIGSQRPLCTGR